MPACTHTGLHWSEKTPSGDDMNYFYLDLLERARHGKPVTKSEWDFEHVMMPVRRLVKKYGLAWDKNEIIPQDVGLVERIFQAALELAQTAGVYYQSTGTIIPFEKGEIEQALRSMPPELTMGEGKDMRTLFPRQVMDSPPSAGMGRQPGCTHPRRSVSANGNQLDAGTAGGPGNLRFVDAYRWV